MKIKTFMLILFIVAIICSFIAIYFIVEKLLYPPQITIDKPSENGTINIDDFCSNFGVVYYKQSVYLCNNETKQILQLNATNISQIINSYNFSNETQYTYMGGKTITYI